VDVEHGMFEISLSVAFESSLSTGYIMSHLDTLHTAMTSLPKQRVRMIALRSLGQPFRWDGGSEDRSLRDLIAKLVPCVSKFRDLGVEFVDEYDNVDIGEASGL
jgi:hypothetical protein